MQVLGDLRWISWMFPQIISSWFMINIREQLHYITWAWKETASHLSVTKWVGLGHTLLYWIITTTISIISPEFEGRQCVVRNCCNNNFTSGLTWQYPYDEGRSDHHRYLVEPFHHSCITRNEVWSLKKSKSNEWILETKKRKVAISNTKQVKYDSEKMQPWYARA